jgi:pimeloyl-ACP methyl ester carboxylesterase/DNA-binding CsgD family transcriptional regulator
LLEPCVSAPRVQFATTHDGFRIAYTSTGDGYPLFWLPHFLASHVQLEWDFPQRYVYTTLSERFRVVRLDNRGLGLSDRAVDDIGLPARMLDVEAVADRAGCETFAVVGIEGGGNLAAAFAAAYPNRVSHLVLINWTPRFSEETGVQRLSTLGLLMRRDWEMFTENIGTSSFGYDTPLAAGYARLVRSTLTQAMAIRYGDQLTREDMVPTLERVQCETLVLHSERNFYASENAARLAAASAPGASLVTFPGALPDHIEAMLRAISEFVGMPASPDRPAAPGSATESSLFTSRELEILQHLARGLSNREIADVLVLSPRTVERHLENIYRKGGFRNRAEATAYAVSNRLTGPA